MSITTSGASSIICFDERDCPAQHVLEHVSVGGGAAMRPFGENSAEIFSSLLPTMEQFGIATAHEVQVDTLADRLEQRNVFG